MRLFICIFLILSLIVDCWKKVNVTYDFSCPTGPFNFSVEIWEEDLTDFFDDEVEFVEGTTVGFGINNYTGWIVGVINDDGPWNNEFEFYLRIKTNCNWSGYMKEVTTATLFPYCPITDASPNPCGYRVAVDLA